MSRHRLWICFGSLVMLGAITAEAFSFDEAFSALADPVEVVHRSGRDFIGYPLQVTPHALVLGRRSDGGSIDYTFSRSEVIALKLPGEQLKSAAFELIETGEVAAGLDLIDLIFASRFQFFEWMPVSEAGWFTESIPAYRAHGRVAEALRRAEILRPFVVADRPASDRIRDEVLLCHFLLGDEALALDLAVEWIAAQPREAGSALGWFVQGKLLQHEAAEEAFATFLRPIVFSGGQSMPFLDRCYAGAIEAALTLGRPTAAEHLVSEMERRAIEWPSDHPHPPAVSLFSYRETLDP